ncbi:ornithine cyclodeaminase family protein [Pyramidobacter sp. SM-530-WT-4B]|uniref:Ornithine cyclodeaminase family protein n=1 Tax=Pyramidobacter porci TaxID=2605789 RepID=A0A6L5YCA3_9BACT|nr:ornithine cyclodeaminase family protein [Pyramidobacter porci]MST55688.1 ornithine cyclodeaminase family protein [Pyramidobacter porci]
MSTSHLEILFLNNEEVNSLAGNSMPDVIHDIERVLSMLDKGEAINAGKIVLHWGKTIEEENIYGRINAMPGFVGGEYNMAGIKWIGSNPNNYKQGLPRATVTVILNDPISKVPVCISDATTVSAKRTGAVAGLAMKYLAVQNAQTMTIFGAGAQSRTQLEAAMVVRPSIKEVYITDIVFERAESYAAEMTAKYPGLKVTAVQDASDACRKSDIISTVTIATEPVVQAEWIKKGALMINNADYEYTYDCVKLADKIFVDTWETIKHRMISTVALMWRDGLFKDEQITAELGEIINGKKKGRENDEETIYFNAVGMGIEDIAVVTRAYHKAVKQGVGTKVPYWV